MPVVWIPSLMRALTDGKEQVTVEGETLACGHRGVGGSLPWD